MIFIMPDRVDESWRLINDAVQAEKLWCAKVSTRAGFKPPTHLICVYTKDWRDKNDVFRHREALRQLGFTSTLYYKPDAMTLAGKQGSIYSG